MLGQGFMLDSYVHRWGLIPDGEPILTAASQLLRVRFGDRFAMIKVAIHEEEKTGARLMRWWDGQGAAQVLAYDGDAHLLEYAEPSLSLGQLASGGADDEASRIICTVVRSLHAPRATPPPPLTPLEEWFEALQPAANAHGGILRLSASLVPGLLAEQQDVGPLHGDIHHGNILNFGPRGWLAIDPKGLIGERTFDYANLFCNPDSSIAARPARLTRQLAHVSDCTGIEPQRLLHWIIAWAGLSAAFSLQDGFSPQDAFRIAEIAAAELSR
jgi:streptomycin 6-kinase